MFNLNGKTEAKAKFLVVRAAKKHSDQRHLNKLIKLNLVDHSGSCGIPYKHKLEDDDDEKLEKSGIPK